MLLLFNFSLKDRSDEKRELHSSVMEMMSTLWRLNQCVWLWLHRINEQFRAGWEFPLDRSLEAMDQKFLGVIFFKKIHEVSETLLEQICIA